VLSSWITADSLGARTDSLEGDAPAPEGRIPVTGAPGAPLPLDRVRESDLIRLGGLSPDSAQAAAAYLREGAGSRLRDLAHAPPALRRTLRRLAPYLADAGWSPGREAAPEGVSSLSWTRSLRAGKGRLPRAQNDLDLRRPFPWGRLQGRIAAEEGKSLARVRGTASLSAGAFQLCVGRAGPPLLWGIGLAARGAPVSLRSGATADGSRSQGAKDGVRSGKEAPAFFSPSLAGTERFLGLAVGRREGFSCFALREENANAAGCLVHGRSGSAGVLIQGAPGSRVVRSLWLTRRSPGDEVAAELAGPAGSPLVLGLRWSSARGRDRLERALWQDLFFQEPMRGRGGDTGSAEKLRRLRAGLRWRGQDASVEILARTRATGGLLAAEGRGSQSVKLNLSGAPVPEWRYDLRFEEGRQTWSAAQVGGDGREETSHRLQARWRLRALIEARDRLLVHRGLLGVEVGAEERRSRSANGTERGAFSPWWGISHRETFGHGGEWSIGLLEAHSPIGSTLSLAPTWAGGTRFALSRGLYGAAAARGRAGPCRVRLRFLWPCWREEADAVPPGPMAELNLQMVP
jgi:hypothetical protein